MLRTKWASAIFSLWIVVISYRYINTVVRGFYSPFNLGNDIEWFAIWLAIAIVLVIVSATAKRAVIIVFSSVAVASVLMLILSGTIVAALTACAILLVAHVVGRRLLLLFRVGAKDTAITIPLGLIAIALGGFILAALHLLTPLSIASLLAALAAVSSSNPRLARRGGCAEGTAGVVAHKPSDSVSDLPGASRHPSSRGGDSSSLFSVSHSPSFPLPLLFIAPVVLLNLVWAVAPEIQYDANNYHLAVSQIYLNNHGFTDLPYFFHSYFYHFIEMLFTMALGLQGAAAAKLLSFGFGLVASLAVFSLGRLAFDARVGAWAAAFFYTTPIVSWLSGTAYIDNAVAMFLAATVISFIRWSQNNEEIGWLYAASLLAGATLAAKINAAFGLPVMFGFAVWQLRTRIKVLAVCAVLLLSVALPWYALTYHWTGNPVLPMLNGLFKSPLWDLENRVMDANTYGIGASAASLFRLPFSLIWNTIRFGTATPRGSAGITLLLALPFCIALIVAGNRIATILIGIGVVYVLLWAFSFQNIRYYVHILPVICVVGVATIFHFSGHEWTDKVNRICLAMVLIFQFAPTSMQFWNIPERFPVAIAMGKETREGFLRRSLPSYAGAEHLNAVLRPGERVLGVAVEDVRSYLTAPLETLSDSTHNTVLRVASGMSDGQLLRTLRASQFAYIFATRESLRETAEWYPYLKPEFLDRFAKLDFSDPNTVVYRLSP